jgi:hypothetical protein
MPLIKVTFVFHREPQGWTESYVMNMVTSLTPNQIFTGILSVIMPYRAQMLGTDASLDYVRISYIGTPFTAQVFNVAMVGTGGSLCAPNDVAFLARAYPQTQNSPKAIYLRGIPTVCITGEGISPPAGWAQSYNNFMNQLITAWNWGVWGWMGTNQATKVRALVNGYVINPNFTVTITYNVSSTGNPIFNGIAAQTPLSMRNSGINGKSELNGVNNGYVTSVNSWTTEKPFGVVPYSHGGLGTLEFKTFVAFNRMEIERISNRKEGRELFASRGRQPVRART